MGQLTRGHGTELGFDTPRHPRCLSLELLFAKDHPQEMPLVQTYENGGSAAGSETTRNTQSCSRKVSAKRADAEGEKEKKTSSDLEELLI